MGQIPKQPPQSMIDEAEADIQAHLERNTGYRITPHGLVREGIVKQYEAPDGYPPDVAIAAIDNFGAKGLLEQVELNTFISKSRRD